MTHERCGVVTAYRHTQHRITFMHELASQTASLSKSSGALAHCGQCMRDDTGSLKPNAKRGLMQGLAVSHRIEPSTSSASLAASE